MNMFKKAKAVLWDVTELGFVLMAFGIVAGILTGGRVPFVGDIIGNITELVRALGDNGIVGLMSLGIIAWIFNKK